MKETLDLGGYLVLLWKITKEFWKNKVVYVLFVKEKTIVKDSQ